MSTRKIPGPGILESWRLGREFQSNYLRPLEHIFRQYGNLVALPAFGPPVVFAFHPDAVEHVLKSNAKNYSKAKDLQELKPLLGEGLLISEGELWREHRRTIAPEFQHKKIEGFFPIIQKHLAGCPAPPRAGGLARRAPGGNPRRDAGSG